MNSFSLPQTTSRDIQVDATAEGSSPWPFRLVLLSLVFEFGRPQELIPGIRAIPLPTIINALIALSLFSSGKAIFRNSQTKLWVPLFVLMIIHVPIAVNNFWAAMILKDMIFVFCLYLGIVTYANSFERIRILVKVWIGVHVFLAIYGITKGGNGIGGWMGDENDFCMAINMAIPFSFFTMMMISSAPRKGFYLAQLGVFVTAVMTSLSRGGFMGLAAVGAYCWSKSSRKFAAVIILILVMLLMGALAPEKYWDEIKSSFSDEELEQGTGGDRLYIWGIGFEMFLANPVIGIGQGNFPWTFEEYEAGRTFLDMSRAGRAAHSLYLTLLPEMGLIGVAIFVAMLVCTKRDITLIQKLFKARSKESHLFPRVDDVCDIGLNLSKAMEASLIGFLVSSIFISTLWYPSFWIMMAFVVALRNVCSSVCLARQVEDGNRVSATGNTLRNIGTKTLQSRGRHR